MKSLKFFLVIAIVIFSIITVSFAMYSYKITVNTDMRVFVNGKKFTPTDVNGKPVMIFEHQGTTYAPLRALAEAYGLWVNYDATTRTATVESVSNDTSSHSYDGILDVGPRGTTFVAKTDGTVWAANWSDLGPWFCQNPEDISKNGIVPAMDMIVKKFSIGQWTGFAIDNDHTLWGWGNNIEGQLGAETTVTPVQVLTNVADVCNMPNSTIALTIDGKLWIWGASWSYTPKYIMEGVKQITAEGLVLTESGDLWGCYFVKDHNHTTKTTPSEIILPNTDCFENQSGQHSSNKKRVTLIMKKIQANVNSIEGNFYYDKESTLWKVAQSSGKNDFECQKIMHHVQFACDKKINNMPIILAIDKNNDVFIIESQSANIINIAENGSRLVSGDGLAAFIDSKGFLWSIKENFELEKIDDGVCYAECSDFFCIYIKTNGTLWKKTFNINTPTSQENQLTPEIILHGVKTK